MASSVPRIHETRAMRGGAGAVERGERGVVDDGPHGGAGAAAEQQDAQADGDGDGQRRSGATSSQVMVAPNDVDGALAEDRAARLWASVGLNAYWATPMHSTVTAIVSTIDVPTSASRKRRNISSSTRPMSGPEHAEHDERRRAAPGRPDLLASAASRRTPTTIPSAPWAKLKTPVVV